MIDTSEQYIDMCGAAIEIQAYRCGGQNVKGDYFWHPIDPIRVIGSEAIRKIEDNSIWLPRQDQLQEILKQAMLATELKAGHLVENADISSWTLHCHFTLFVQEWIDIDNKYSFEQLWLMYVMLTKFKKTWDGKEWKKIE